jgi:DNA-binding transcriptional LysR family regulator
MEDLKKHPFIGFVEELLIASELHYSAAVTINYSDAIGADVERRIRSTSILAQLHATLSGSGLCMLPAFVASSYPELVPLLPEQVSVTRSLRMHIHEDHRRAPHVREVAAFIAAEVERNHSLFHAPTAVREAIR